MTSLLTSFSASMIRIETESLILTNLLSLLTLALIKVPKISQPLLSIILTVCLMDLSIKVNILVLHGHKAQFLAVIRLLKLILGAALLTNNGILFNILVKLLKPLDLQLIRLGDNHLQVNSGDQILTELSNLKLVGNNGASNLMDKVNNGTNSLKPAVNNGANNLKVKDSSGDKISNNGVNNNLKLADNNGVNNLMVKDNSWVNNNSTGVLNSQQLVNILINGNKVSNRVTVSNKPIKLIMQVCKVLNQACNNGKTNNREVNMAKHMPQVSSALIIN